MKYRKAIMIDIKKMKKLNFHIGEYCNIVNDCVKLRQHSFPETEGKEEYLVVGAFMSRIASLSFYLMLNSVCWNRSMAMFSLRTQLEAYITLAWVLKDLENKKKDNPQRYRNNSKRYIVTSIKSDRKNAEVYGKYLDKFAVDNPEIEEDKDFIFHRNDHKESEIEIEKWRKLQLQKVGGEEIDKNMPDVASMAKDAGLEAFYMREYKWLCQHSHNSWYLLYHGNTAVMKDKKKNDVRIPVIMENVDPRIMHRSALYLSLACEKIDEIFPKDSKINVMSPIKYWETNEPKIIEILQEKRESDRWNWRVCVRWINKKIF